MSVKFTAIWHPFLGSYLAPSADKGQTIRFFGGELLSHVLIRRVSSPKLCVLGFGTRSRCAFQLPGWPHRLGHGSGFRPRKQGGIAASGRLEAGSRSASSLADGALRNASLRGASSCVEATAGDSADRRVRIRFHRDLETRGPSRYFEKQLVPHMAPSGFVFCGPGRDFARVSRNKS